MKTIKFLKITGLMILAILVSSVIWSTPAYAKSENKTVNVALLAGEVCPTVSHTRTDYNVLKQPLYSMTYTVQYCYNKTAQTVRLVSGTQNVKPSVSSWGIGWQWVAKDLKYYTVYSSGNKFVSTQAQGHWQLCVGGYCGKHDYQWVKMDMTWYGTVTKTSG